MSAGLAVVLVIPAFAQDSYPDPCDGEPPETRSVVRCRDGDPSCDMDRMCDGACLVKLCIVPPENPASCLVTSRACPRNAEYADLGDSDSPWLMPVGSQNLFRRRSTIVGAKCLPARRRCVPPDLGPCVVTIDSDPSGTFSCRARLFASRPDRAGPTRFEVLLSEVDGDRLIRVSVEAAPAVGVTTVSPPASRLWMSFKPPVVGDIRAELALTEIVTSRTSHHEVHGRLDVVATPTATIPLRFTVRADF